MLKWDKDTEYKNHGTGCINGWTGKTLSGTQVASLANFDQNLDLPGQCPNKLQVSGAMNVAPSYMGIYISDVQADDIRKSPPTYRTTAGAIIFRNSESVWVLQPDNNKSPWARLFIEKQDPPTPCPPIGTFSASKQSMVPSFETIDITLSYVMTSIGPYTPVPTIRACCSPWGAPDRACKQAVCNCWMLNALSAEGFISDTEKNRWKGQCDFRMGHSGDATMTSAGPWEWVTKGILDSPINDVWR